MTKIDMTTRCNQVAALNTPEMKDWGFSFLVDSELDALQIAYAYRNNAHGVKVDHCPAVAQFMVTVWNDKAKAMEYYQKALEKTTDSAAQLYLRRKIAALG